MAYDIFSSIDYYYSNFGFLKFVSFSWFFSVFLFILFILPYYSLSRLNLFFRFFNLNAWVRSLYRDKFIFGIISCFFIFIVFQNVYGLFPYTFGIRRHFLRNIMISLEIWLVIMFWGIFHRVVSFLSHFVLFASPLGLGVGLCFIETIRNFIRFLTLALRLAVNITTGHVILGLVGNACFSFFGSIRLFFLLFLSFYLIFDLFIGFIQGFVFGLLCSQYFEEVTVFH